MAPLSSPLREQNTGTFITEAARLVDAIKNHDARWHATFTESRKFNPAFLKTMPLVYALTSCSPTFASAIELLPDNISATQRKRS